LTAGIIKAEQAGFCYGVRRAMRLALDLVGSGAGPIYTLGPLMHSPQEVARLAKMGVVPRETVEQCRGGLTLVRTHGISKQEYRRAGELGVELVDAVCPRVKVPRRLIESFGRDGRTVFLLGDGGHPEVRALESFAGGRVFVFGSEEDIPALSPDTPVGLVAQTTQSTNVFENVARACRCRYSDLEVNCTICDDAGLRQAEGRQMASAVDVMLVIGGHNSANTRRLAEICGSIQIRTHHVESAGELAGISFENADKIGIASGASTPDWLIEQVEKWLRIHLAKGN